MRRILMLVLGAGLVAVSCTPPPAGVPNRYDCAAAPVSLGEADRVEAVSASGEVVVLSSYPDFDEGVGQAYDIVDRRAGQRYTARTTPVGGDGARIYLDPAGRTLRGHQYLSPAPGEPPWFDHDVASRLSSPIEPATAELELPRSFSSDMRFFIREHPDRTWERIEFLTGQTTELGVATSALWRTAGFSPDLSKVVQYSSASSRDRDVRVLDMVSGAEVAAFEVRGEDRYSLRLSFVDDRTLLVDGAAPEGAAADGVDDDGAFVFDIATGAVTRLDPGVADAHTTAASSDGARSLHWRGVLQYWVDHDGQRTQLEGARSPVGNTDLSVVVTINDGEAFLNCF